MHALIKLAVSASLLSLAACGAFAEPDWLTQARALEKQKRPLCTRLNGALHELDRGAAELSSQQEYDRHLTSMRPRIEAAVSDCRARNRTY